MAKTKDVKSKKGIGKFVKDVRQEYRNVNWPTKDEVFSSTIVVIVFVVVISTFLGFADYSILKLINLILGIN